MGDKAPALFIAALSLVIITAVSGISYALFIRPLYQKYLRNEATISQQLTLISLVNLKKTDPTSYAQKIDAYRAEIVEVDNQLPTVESATELMNQAVSRASTLGLHFQSIEQEGSVAEEEYTILPTHVVLMGRYIDLLNWLYWMSNSHSAIQVENVELSVFSENEEKSILAAEFDFKIYARASSGFGLSTSAQ